ncbi:MAG: DUF2391 family protein [Candidatus Pacearchaeota archaeon]
MKNQADSKRPIKTNVSFHDFLQIIIGAFILAIPVGFTQEVWELGETLSIFKILVIILLTFFFIGIFTYYHYHRKNIMKNPIYHLSEMTKRIFATYIISFIVVALFLWSIDVTHWNDNAILAFKTVAIVTFPSSIGAVISDRV